MNLKVIRSKKDTEGFLLSITKNCTTINKQTCRKAEGTLEYKLKKSRETFSSKRPIET